MVTLNVSLPDTLKDWIEAEIEAGRYTDAGDYVRSLIRRDQERNDALIDALEEGLASGVTHYSMDEIWESAKARADADKAKRA
jgi:antitoxin ParD1/3/4